MKNKCAVPLLALAYAAVLIGLLVLQALTIDGRLPRIAANLAALLLVIPDIFLLRAYLRLKDQEEKVWEQALREKGEKSPEEMRVDFYSQMEQCGLSAREQEVAWLIYRGYRNLQIAEELYISETTVKKHASHIYEKTQVSGRKEFREKYQELLNNM